MLWVVAIGLVGAGCSSAEPASSAPASFSGPPLLSMPSRAGTYDIAIRTSPSTLSQGDQSVEYTVTSSSDGSPSSGLSLAIVPWMPAMGHGTSVVPSVAETAPGVYVASSVDWYMPGQWVLRTTITAPADGDGNGEGGGDDGGGVGSDYVEPSFAIP